MSITTQIDFSWQTHSDWGKSIGINNGRRVDVLTHVTGPNELKGSFQADTTCILFFILPGGTLGPLLTWVTSFLDVISSLQKHQIIASNCINCILVLFDFDLLEPAKFGSSPSFHFSLRAGTNSTGRTSPRLLGQMAQTHLAWSSLGLI